MTWGHPRPEKKKVEYPHFFANLWGNWRKITVINISLLSSDRLGLNGPRQIRETFYQITVALRACTVRIERHATCSGYEFYRERTAFACLPLGVCVFGERKSASNRAFGVGFSVSLLTGKPSSVNNMGPFFLLHKYHSAILGCLTPFRNQRNFSVT